MPIIYKKGSLFNAPKNSILVHAVNCKGVWSSGIALEFHKKFLDSFEFYKDTCTEFGSAIIGTSIICPEENDYVVGCLVTSDGYGKFKDSQENILKNTRLALPALLQETREIHSCLFNSGLFEVPWKNTEKVLLDVMKEFGYSKDWTVWQQ